MKRIYTYFILVLSIFISSCQELTIDSQPDAPLSMYVDALDSYTLLAKAPDRIVFNISSNTPWTIESDSQWCLPTPAMSAASSLVSEIEVNTEDNEGLTSRTATLTIKAEGIAAAKVITINQASKESLTVIPYDERIPTEGGTFSFKISSNKPWEIIPSTAFLSQIDKLSGEGSEDGTYETVTVTIPVNSGSVRSGILTVKTLFEEYQFTVTQNGVLIELADMPESTDIKAGDGRASVISVPIRANKSWMVNVPSEYNEWLSAEKVSQTQLDITVKENPMLHERVAEITLTTEEYISGFDGITFCVTQPSAFVFAEGVVKTIDPETGYTKVELKAGEMFRSTFTIKKGRTIIELDDMKMSSICNLGFNFTSSTSANYKLHIEGNNLFMFRCAGGFGWGPPVQKTTTLEQVNAIRRLEFVVDDDPENLGKVMVSIYIDGALYGSQTGRKDVFAENDPGCNLIFEAGIAPTEGDYCVFKGITYTSK